jgi:hypothetical protein
MLTWVFQGDPKKFDIDNAICDEDLQSVGLTWLANQNASKMQKGDVAYLYRTGKNNAIIARCTLTSEYMEIEPDSNVLRYWTKEAKDDQNLWGRKARVWLQINEIDPSLEGIPYSQLKHINNKIGKPTTNIQINGKDSIAIDKLWSEINTHSLVEN